MPVTIKNVELWRAEIDNKPGTLAATLAPLAQAGADLQVVMGYRFPGNEAKAAVEVTPVKGKKSSKAAQSGGLQSSKIATLIIEDNNKAGLGHVVSQALADAGVNIAFLVAMVVGRKYSCVAGFDSAEDAKKAAAVIKKATASKKKKK